MTTIQTAAPAVPATFKIAELSGGTMFTNQVLRVVGELGIADMLIDGPRTAEQLAATFGAHAPSLYRILRAAAMLGLFDEDEVGAFALTPLGEALRSDVPGSARWLAVFHGAPWHWEAWAGMVETVRTGRPSIEIVTGQPVFAYFASHPEQAEQFNLAMNAYSEYEAAAVVGAYDFSGLRRIVDVGGGQGLLLARILQQATAARGVLFDFPPVVDGARALLASEGVLDRCEIAGGDFFQSVPPQGDAYLLKNILHDFPDEPAIGLLRAIRAAMAADGRVLIVQDVIPPAGAPSVGKLLDIQMLLIGGKERTEGEWRALFAAAGLRWSRAIPTPVGVSVIEALPA